MLVCIKTLGGKWLADGHVPLAPPVKGLESHKFVQFKRILEMVVVAAAAIFPLREREGTLRFLKNFISLFFFFFFFFSFFSFFSFFFFSFLLFFFQPTSTAPRRASAIISYEISLHARLTIFLVDFTVIDSSN